MSYVGLFNERFPRCNSSGKLMYPDKKTGLAELARYARARGSFKVYRCPFCDHYHSTSTGKGKRGKKR